MVSENADGIRAGIPVGVREVLNNVTEFNYKRAFGDMCDYVNVEVDQRLSSHGGTSGMRDTIKTMWGCVDELLSPTDTRGTGYSAISHVFNGPDVEPKEDLTVIFNSIPGIHTGAGNASVNRRRGRVVRKSSGSHVSVNNEVKHEQGVQCDTAQPRYTHDSDGSIFTNSQRLRRFTKENVPQRVRAAVPAVIRDTAMDAIDEGIISKGLKSSFDWTREKLPVVRTALSGIAGAGIEAMDEVHARTPWVRNKMPAPSEICEKIPRIRKAGDDAAGKGGGFPEREGSNKAYERVPMGSIIQEVPHQDIPDSVGYGYRSAGAEWANAGGRNYEVSSQDVRVAYDEGEGSALRTRVHHNSSSSNEESFANICPYPRAAGESAEVYASMKDYVMQSLSGDALDTAEMSAKLERLEKLSRNASIAKKSAPSDKGKDGAKSKAKDKGFFSKKKLLKKASKKLGVASDKGGDGAVSKAKDKGFFHKKSLLGKSASEEKLSVSSERHDSGLDHIDSASSRVAYTTDDVRKDTEKKKTKHVLSSKVVKEKVKDLASKLKKDSRTEHAKVEENVNAQSTAETLSNSWCIDDVYESRPTCGDAFQDRSFSVDIVQSQALQGADLTGRKQDWERALSLLDAHDNENTHKKRRSRISKGVKNALKVESNGPNSSEKLEKRVSSREGGTTYGSYDSSSGLYGASQQENGLSFREQTEVMSVGCEYPSSSLRGNGASDRKTAIKVEKVDGIGRKFLSITRNKRVMPPGVWSTLNNTVRQLEKKQSGREKWREELGKIEENRERYGLPPSTNSAHEVSNIKGSGRGMGMR